jgi:hypothetical protein
MAGCPVRVRRKVFVFRSRRGKPFSGARSRRRGVACGRPGPAARHLKRFAEAAGRPGFSFLRQGRPKAALSAASRQKAKDRRAISVGSRRSKRRGGMDVRSRRNNFGNYMLDSDPPKALDAMVAPARKRQRTRRRLEKGGGKIPTT